MRISLKQSAYKQLLLFFFTLFFTCVTPAATNVNSAAPQPGNKEIKIGISASLSGGAAQSGKNMKLGISVYFDKINAEGGIDGYQLKLIAMDDGYEPLRAASNLHQLIDNDKVLSIIGNNGTPAAVVAVPIVNESKILLFGARTGSALLRKTPPDRYVINFRASYFDELNLLIKNLLASGIKPENIAFFTQNDAFGESIYQAGMRSLKEQGFSNPETLPSGRYDRNSLDVTPALSTIIEQAKHPIKAIIVGGVYGPNAQFIKLAKGEYPQAIFLTVSGLINPKDLDESFNGKIFASQVVPDVNSNLPAVVEYREDLKKFGQGAEPIAGSLEGYLVAKLFTIGLKEAIKKNMLTREGIIDVFDNMQNIDLGIDVKMGFTKTNHTGLNTLWLTVFKDKKFEPTTKLGVMKKK